jgi:hypothetical protein
VRVLYEKLERSYCEGTLREILNYLMNTDADCFLKSFFFSRMVKCSAYVEHLTHRHICPWLGPVTRELEDGSVSALVILQDSGAMERSACRRTLHVQFCNCWFWYNRWIIFPPLDMSFWNAIISDIHVYRWNGGYEMEGLIRFHAGVGFFPNTCNSRLGLVETVLIFLLEIRQSEPVTDHSIHLMRRISIVGLWF